ncbi:MAG: hypothetical protein GXY82_05055 [Methanospirillum sp.]|nr:hypothetical protein [Methanospirillum sp.]
MAEEKSLLEQVREKELALAAEYDRVCAQMDALKESARRDAWLIVDRAEGEGRAAASARYDEATAALDAEISAMREEALRREREMHTAIESRLAGVAEELVGYVVRKS